MYKYSVGSEIILRTTVKLFVYQEKFENTKGVIGIHTSKDRHHNGQRINGKRTNNDLHNIHIKLKIE
jgi:hypothetical protein